MLQWVRSYLTGCSQLVEVNFVLATPQLLLCTVPQGSVLGPLLFTMYTTPFSLIITAFGLKHHRYAGVLGWLLVVILFAPIRGGSLGICFVCYMLYTALSEALIYSNHPRAAAASSYLAIIFGRIASGVPWFLRSTAEPMQHPHQCWRWCRPWMPYITSNSVFDIRSLTWDEWSYPEGVILTIVVFQH